MNLSAAKLSLKLHEHLNKLEFKKQMKATPSVSFATLQQSTSRASTTFTSPRYDRSKLHFCKNCYTSHVDYCPYPRRANNMIAFAFWKENGITPPQDRLSAYQHWVSKQPADDKMEALF